MSDRLAVLKFLESAAEQMARLARRDGVPKPVADEIGQIALELAAEATTVRAELELEALNARAANTNRRGLVGLSD